MKISIKFFAGLAEVTNKRKYTLNFEQPLKVKDLTDFLIKDFPGAKDIIRKSMVSINQEFASENQIIAEGDEIAIIPPVGGGENSLYVITPEVLSVDKLISKVSNPKAGAILTFVGTVREYTKGIKTVSMEYEAYTEMAIKKLEQIGDEVYEKWPETKIAITHRIGKLDIEDISVVIAVASPHRATAFEAGRYAIERLKVIVPVWKKEIRENEEVWINNKEVGNHD